MGESAKHLELVKRIITYMEKLPDIEASLIQSDLPESIEKPDSTMEGFRPDIYYNYSNFMIIGEAKTSYDFERKHSIEQYEAYYSKCNAFNGKSIFILAIPWTESISAKNLLRRIRRNSNYDIETWVINDTGRVEKL